MNKRRDHGDGSIFQDASGRWVAMLDLGRKPDGKRHRRKFTAKTKTEAKAKLAKAKAEAEAGLTGGGRLTVSRYLSDWLANVPASDITDSTRASYAQVIRLYIEPEVGAVKLADLSPEHVRKMLRQMETDGKSARTRQYARAVLRRALRHAEQYGMVARNVAAIVDGPKIPAAKLDDTLTAEQAAKVLTAAKAGRTDDKGQHIPERLEALAVVVLSLGLRPGEALALRWEDLDLEAGELSVTGTLKPRAGGGFTRTAPKTRASVRTIPLPGHVADALKAHRKAQAAEQLASPIWENAEGYVFTSAVGTPIHQRNALRWWHELCDRADVRRCRLHATRHTAATLLLERGVPLEVVSAILGHASLSITADVYARVTQDSKRRALSALDDLAGNG